MHFHELLNVASCCVLIDSYWCVTCIAWKWHYSYRCVGCLCAFIKNNDHETRRKYRQVQVHRKMNCPAKMYVYEHVRFPKYEVSTSMYLRISVDNPCTMW